MCVAYDVDGERVDEMPMTQTDFHHAKPIYEYFDGWTEDISGARDARRPAGHRAGATSRRSRSMSGARISAIGVGPGPRAGGRAASRCAEVLGCGLFRR